MIRNDSVFKIGHISRTHGVKGEVEILFTDDPFDRGELDYLVLEIDGIMVPFFFSEYRYKGGHSALFTFEDVDSEEKARRFVGLSVFYPKAEAARIATEAAEEGEEMDLSSLRALTGYRVFAIDEEESTEDELATYDLGEITHVDDSSMNTLITVVDDEDPSTGSGQATTERLLPLHTDFIVEIDPAERTLLLDIPLELLDLN